MLTFPLSVQAGQELDEDEMSLCSESNNSVDTSGTPIEMETLEENLDDLYLGTTTRHQWQVREMFPSYNIMSSLLGALVF